MNQFEILLRKYENELIQIKKIIDPNKGFTIIENCPWIVVSTDFVYTVGETEKKAEVEIGKTFPCQFSSKAANDLVNNFTAYNGKGPIIWKKVSVNEFYTKRAELHKETINFLLENMLK